MCLFVTIEALDQRTARCSPSDLAAAGGLQVDQPQRGRFRLFLPGDCGCGFVLGNPAGSDWTWAPSAKKPLRSTLRAARKSLKRFRFTATWMGERAPTEVVTTLAGLVAHLEQGTFSPGTAYVVTGR